MADGEVQDEDGPERDDADEALTEPAATPAEQKPAPEIRVETLARPVQVPTWIQLVLLPLAIIGLFELAKATGSLVAVLIGAIVIAVILNPLVKALRRFMPHGFAILLSWIIVWLIVAAVIAILAEPLADQISRIAANFPHWEHKATHTLASIQTFLNRRGVKIHITGQGQSALQTLEKKLSRSSGTIASVLSNVLTKLVSLSVDLILTFVLSIYFLVYSGRIGDQVRRILPPGDGTPQDDYPTMIQKAVSGYVRAQLSFSVIMGFSAALLLWLTGVTGIFPDGSRFTVFFGLFYALMELIPYIGPILGPIPPILVALVTHPIAALWLLIVFVGLQQLEGHVVAPQLFRIGLRINPILVILALLIGEKLFGIAGALLALPVATMIRQTVLYGRAHLVLESWKAPPL